MKKSSVRVTFQRNTYKSRRFIKGGNRTIEIVIQRSMPRSPSSKILIIRLLQYMVTAISKISSRMNSEHLSNIKIIKKSIIIILLKYN